MDLRRCTAEPGLRSAAVLLPAAIRLQRSLDLYHRERVSRGDGNARATRRDQYSYPVQVESRFPAVLRRRSIADHILVVGELHRAVLALGLAAGGNRLQ